MSRKAYKFDECRSCARVNTKVCRDCDYGEYFSDQEVQDTYERLTATRGRFGDDEGESDEARISHRAFDVDTFANSVSDDDDNEAFDNE